MARNKDWRQGGAVASGYKLGKGIFFGYNDDKQSRLKATIVFGLGIFLSSCTHNIAPILHRSFVEANLASDLLVEGRVTESRGKCTIFDCNSNINVIEVTRILSKSRGMSKLTDADIAVVSACTSNSLFLGKTYRLSLTVNSRGGVRIPTDYSDGVKMSSVCQFNVRSDAIYIESGSSWLKVDPVACDSSVRDEVCIYARK